MGRLGDMEREVNRSGEPPFMALRGRNSELIAKRTDVAISGRRPGALLNSTILDNFRGMILIKITKKGDP